MFNYVWKPTEETGLDKTFTGHVVASIPKHKDRIEFVKRLTLASKEAEMVSVSGMEQTELLLGLAEKQITEVKLTRIDDGYVFQSVDELNSDADGFQVLTQVGMKLSQGVRLGKN